jgi:hypothetical protein
MQEAGMLFPMRIKNLRATLALSAAFTVLVGPAVEYAAVAAVEASPADPAGDQLRDQLNDVVNTPYDFCDPAAEHAHLMAILTANGNLYRHQLGNHHPGPEDIKLAEDKAVQDAKADGAPEDLLYVTDYETAGRRGDAKMQKALFKKMTPAAQAQAAHHDHNYPLVIKLLTPMADAGDVNAQLTLAGIYSFATTGFSPKYLEPLPPALLAKLQPVLGKHWPPPEPPENLPLAFRYFQSAAAKGNVFGQWGLARAYACGFGTKKNLILAYMWFGLGLAQRGVTVEMTGASLPMKGYQKDYAVDRDFVIARMKPEEIEQARNLIKACASSGYEKCNGE